MFFRRLFLFAFALTILLSSMAWQSSSAPTSTIEQLQWLAGGWTTSRNGTIVEEHWTQPAAGTMIGMGRTIANNKTVFYEYLRIETRPDGLFYVAHPKARPGTDFKLATITEHEAVFENPQHDFPKRITYRRNSDGTVTARIEGNPQDKQKAEEFHYQRIAR